MRTLLPDDQQLLSDQQLRDASDEQLQEEDAYSVEQAASDQWRANE